METKEKIIDAAMVCISEKGFDETTISDIVKQAGVAQGTYYLYFDHKRDILKDIMLRVRSEVEQKIEEGILQEDPAVEKIHKALKSAFLIYKKYRKLAAPLQSSGVALEIQHYSNKIGRQFISRLAKWIEEGLAEGEFSGDIKNTRLQAVFIISLFERVVYSSLIFNEIGSFEEIFPELVSFIDRGLGLE